MDIRGVLFAFGSTFIGYLVWRAGARKSSLIRGTATSKIASAAKGYTEVQGRARCLPSGALRDPITKEPCVWFNVVTEKFSILDKFTWKQIGHANSSSPFVVDDGSGLCLIVPHEASMDSRNEKTIVKERWNLRHRVWWIREGDPVYAIGYLQRTPELAVKTMLAPMDTRKASAARERPSKDEEIVAARAAEILRSWKRNPNELIRKFDADGDGKVDFEEWEKARSEAHAKAESDLGLNATVAEDADDAATYPGAITHRMHKPPDGRPFLLTTYGEASLVSNSRKQSFWGLVFFVIGVLMLLGLLSECVGGR